MGTAEDFDLSDVPHVRRTIGQNILLNRCAVDKYGSRSCVAATRYPALVDATDRETGCTVSLGDIRRALVDFLYREDIFIGKALGCHDPDGGRRFLQTARSLLAGDYDFHRLMRGRDHFRESRSRVRKRDEQ
ncbi:hypothetical protein L286_11350 [Sphingobium sp. HDIP04]|nr:hypothetical protein L286_11350 [Sphingobium sp. HDIP04]